MKTFDSSSLLNQISNNDVWESFFSYKTSIVSDKVFIPKLRRFIDNKEYIPICQNIFESKPFPIPTRGVISKSGSQKKRIIYTYPFSYNVVLKLITWLVLRKYDYIFSDNLYSFRPGRTAKDAIKKLISASFNIYSYKVDISNYFNSIPTNKLLPMLKDILKDDPTLYALFKSILENPFVKDGNQVISENKGIMAGTPIASFFANVYLYDLDKHFENMYSNLLYARYSDDIIVLTDSERRINREADFIREYISDKGLSINPDKECFSTPTDGFCFLGFSYCNDVIDISPITFKKLKAKMRRKTRALKRWGDRNKIPYEKRAKAFIRVFNRKLLESPEDRELSWAYWFFPIINTTKTLKAIDEYAKDCIRYLLTDTRRKSRYNARYDQLKHLGYKSLVNEYYK